MLTFIQNIIFTKFRFALFIGLIYIACSCGASRYKGRHASVSKEQELKAKSDFNLKQAKGIVNENEKNRPQNERRAEKKRKKLNKEIEADTQNQHQTTPTMHHINTNKPVPSYP